MPAQLILLGMMDNFSPSFLQILATLFFALAILHTFLVKKFEQWGNKCSTDSISAKLLHFLAEVEVVFGIWSALFIICFMWIKSPTEAFEYLESLNYTEPAFVFVVMTLASARPLVLLSQKMIEIFSGLLPLHPRKSFFITTLIIGPTLGSFITEPAAMTLTAIILLKYFYAQKMSNYFKYATLGLLFVNVSVGGTLSHFAAPPVVMVASKWGWNMMYMMTHFGWKALAALIFSTLTVTFLFRRELEAPIDLKKRDEEKKLPPFWVTCIHLLFLALVVITAHHLNFFMGVFLFYLGFFQVSSEYQHEMSLNRSLMVGLFLAGLITLGSMQDWWLQQVLVKLNDLTLYLGATGLTAITDNAALTYLGSLVDLSDSAKYFLMAGAVTGGGLTVIANAPNPAGYGILKDSFEDGINPFALFLGALFPTTVVLLAFLFLPSI